MPHINCYAKQRRGTENQNKKKFEKTVEEMRRRFFGDIYFGIRLFCRRGNPRFIFRFRSGARGRGGKLG